jgi:hypothetical protein
MGDNIMGKKQKKGFLRKVIDAMGWKSNKDLEQDKTIKKLKLEILALKQMILVYEKAILNEREVATNALKSLDKMNVPKI